MKLRTSARNAQFLPLFQGFGMMLMEEAERIARDEHGASTLAVISGEPPHPRRRR